ncbi:MAG: ABC transporter [Anaerolineaceae bacterium 4572_5.2]|nr:MAG: ABC transporter [Anaerolineaceae bacterium 4572_5.2]
MIAAVALLDSIFTYISKLIIDEGIVAQNIPRLNQLVGIYFSLIFVSAAAVFGFIYLTGILGERIRYEMRRDLFNHLQELSFSYFDKTPVGWIMSRVTSDTERIAELITWRLLDITWGVMSIGSSVIFMMLINWKLALVVALIVPVIVIVAIQFKKRIIVQFRLVRKMNSKVTGAYNENITGVRVVKALVREDRNMQEFDELATSMYKAGYRAAWLSALFLPAVQIIAALAMGAVIWYGGLQARTGEMTIGGIQAFISYLVFMLWPIQELSRAFAEMQQAIASAERTFSLQDAKADVVDRPHALDPGTIRGDIRFENVDFYYEKGKPVLKNFNLHIEQGETIALVGPTGAGKSTIVNLLCRFYEPKEGRIRIGGLDYTGLTLHAIQSRVGIVLQTPHLFSGTIRENLRYGRLDATDSEIEIAAKLAHAHEFIVETDKGYDSEVGEGGNLLSVGQKQLVSLARAVLANPDLFIMDEATSSVDTVTEALIQQGMDELMRNRTSLIIAHRLSTIKRADRILVIEGGGISEAGTHAELIRQRGHYYNLYTNQFRQELGRQYAVA